MIVILFRSKLTPAAGQDYADTNAELERYVQTAPGFVAAKSFKAEDGERLTLVWWRDRETLEQWRHNERHVAAKTQGRNKWYEYYKIEVAEVYRQSDFERPAAQAAVPATGNGGHTE
jgi:heme-degrading monooxygenase HmoA